MRSRDALFCSLLKAGLWNETRDIHLSKDEFALLWKDAVRQVCRGLVSHPLVLSGSLPSQIVSRLQDHLLAIAGLGLKMDRVIEKSVLELQSNGIDPVLLKGRGVGSYYPNPMIRENGDVDLYVGPGNYKAAFEVLVKLADKPEDTLFEGGSKHSHLEIDGVIVEIHKYCEILPRRYDARFQSIARKGLTEGLVIMPFGEACVSTPETTFNAFFIFNHLWRHFVTEGVGFRQVCDWTVFLHANAGKIDHEKLRSILESLDLLRAWRVFGRIAVDILGLPEDEMPFSRPVSERSIDRVVDMIMEEGNFGHEREDWWTVPRESFFDKVRVFFMIAKRYFALVPIFGKVVLVEYFSRMRKKFFGQ